MKSIKVNFKDERNYEVVLKWLRSNDIEVIELDNSLPTLNNESSVHTNTSKKDDNFKHYDTKADEIVGFCSRRGKGIAYWENRRTPKKVKYAIKNSLLENGAKWNSDTCLYEFSSVALAKAFMKMQKDRENTKK